MVDELKLLKSEVFFSHCFFELSLLSFNFKLLVDFIDLKKRSSTYNRLYNRSFTDSEYFKNYKLIDQRGAAVGDDNLLL